MKCKIIERFYAIVASVVFLKIFSKININHFKSALAGQSLNIHHFSRLSASTFFGSLDKSVSRAHSYNYRNPIIHE